MISVGVRLTVTDKPKTGGSTPNRLLGTQNGATLKDNIAMVWMKAFVSWSTLLCCYYCSYGVLC